MPRACLVDKPLCDKVQRYLTRYKREYALTQASVTASATHGAPVIVPNEYGLPSDSHWDVSAQAFVQPSDYLLASGDVVAYQGRANPTGTGLTLGFSWAQIDVGYRPHWLSPMTDSSTLISTEAPTMPAVTLSNWGPLTPLGINRLLQYGGGSGLPDSASFLFSDFFKPSGLSQTQGNQQASYVSRIITTRSTARFFSCRATSSRPRL